MSGASTRFDPAEFVRSASRAASGSSEADYRTAAGRAYYAVYGAMRERLCGAKATTPSKLFGTKGRHGEVHRPMATLSSFKKLSPAYNGLLTLRTSSDYVYTVAIDRTAALSAVDQAKWLLGELSKIPDADFKAHPIS